MMGAARDPFSRTRLSLGSIDFTKRVLNALPNTIFGGRPLTKPRKIRVVM